MLSNAAAFRPVIVAWRNGSPVRLEQIANVIDGVDNDKLAAWYNNKRAVILAIQKQPGTNTVDVVDSVRKLLPEFSRSIPPTVHLTIMYDASESIRASIRDVEFTLVLTIGVVVLVIFLFLRNVSATMIPGLAVPFSIVGTFAVMYLLGYSLNNLSLMALTLSVGFVVDDAIVMLENIVRHMEMGQTRMEAALKASREIGFTIISMTISLVAVFIPVLFLGGIVGRLLHEFSVTIVVAILISGFVSLSLTPMLGSRFLKSDHGVRHGFAVQRSGRRLCRPDAAVRAHAADGAALSPRDPGGRGRDAVRHGVPVPDDADGLHPEPGQRVHVRGARWVRRTCRSITWRRTRMPIGEVIRDHPEVNDVGVFVPGQMGVNSGIVFAHMKPRDQRTHSVDQIIEELRPKTMAVPGVLAFMQNPPPITISGQPDRRELVPAHAAKLEPAGDLHVGAAAGGEDAAAARVCGCAIATCRLPARS